MSPHETFFKDPGENTKTRRARRAGRRKVERDAKLRVRKEDRYCRFPACGCKRLGLAYAVAHLQHKGMGGNPAGDRNDPRNLILLCCFRHRERPVSVDMGAIRITPLLEQLGARGPCVFEISLEGLGKAFAVRADDVSAAAGVLTGLNWIELARERGPHDFEPFTPSQARILAKLREMTT